MLREGNQLMPKIPASILAKAREANRVTVVHRLEAAQRDIDHSIGGTPSSTTRDELTEVNIKLIELIAKIKQERWA